MTFLGLAAVGGLSLWIAVVIGRGFSGARFNRALRAYGDPVCSTPETLAVVTVGSEQAGVSVTQRRAQMTASTPVPTVARGRSSATMRFQRRRSSAATAVSTET
jgi:hypothetical protein